MSYFKKYRLKSGLTLTQAAKALGTTPSAVCMWETGVNTPKTAMLPKLAALYGCSVDALLLGEEKEHQGIFLIEDLENRILQTEGFYGLAALKEIFEKWKVGDNDRIKVSVYRNECGDGRCKN